MEPNQTSTTPSMAGEVGRRVLRQRASSSAPTVPAAPSDNVRQTRAAAKRSAMDDIKHTVLHPRKRTVQPNGKRAPFTDISKHANVALSTIPVVDLPDSNKCQESKSTQIL